RWIPDVALATEVTHRLLSGPAARFTANARQVWCTSVCNCTQMLPLPAQQHLRVHRIRMHVIRDAAIARLVPLAFDERGVEIARGGDEQPQPTRAHRCAVGKRYVIAISLPRGSDDAT